jgi:CRP-like cAMP-binding protein
MLSFQDAAPGPGHGAPALSASECDCQVVAEPHGVVFRAGDTKGCVFRIESGAVELEWFVGDGSSGCVERLGPAQLFGVGFLDHHIANAVVVEPSRISCWRREDLTPNFREARIIREREAIETTREFEHRKALVLSGRSKEVSRRLAGFLCLAAQFNVRDGRDPCLIDEGMDPSAVASLLQIDVDTLGRGLVVLERLGLVTREGRRSLRICDLEALSAFANHQIKEGDGPAPAMAA